MMMTRPSLLSLVALTITPLIISSCSTLRKVESMVPEIPEIVLIGKKKDPTTSQDGTYDPSNLEADLIQDAAIFKFNVAGQTRKVVIQLFPDQAPVTVANFQKRIRDGFYDGLAIHRVIPNYLIQTGDPQSRDPESRAAWGTGGNDNALPAEISRRHQPGAVGMARLGDSANRGRRSSGSQFYIALDNLPSLDGKYTIFGQVIQGFETIQQIAEFPADTNDNPYQRIAIKSAKLARAGSHRPEDITTIKRRTSRKTLDQQPTKEEGVLKRTWRQIW